MMKKKKPFLLLGLAAGFAVVLVRASDARGLAHPAAHPAPPAASPQRRNTLTGHVFDESRRPVSDVYLELQDELGVTINRTRSSSSGRYEFPGLSEGRFKVRAMPLGTDYAEQLQEVQISNISALGGGTGGETKQLDFYLSVRPDVSAGPFAAADTLFAQEVPEEAKKLYEKGIGELRAKREREGFDCLRKALEIFPDYYHALNRLGGEYAVRGKQDARYFEAARVLLTRAVEVNSKSFPSLYGLGFAQYHLGLIGPSVENLQRAANVYGKSAGNYLWLGIAQKRAGKLAPAVASLLRANELSKGREAEVHMRLAEIYGEQKRYAEAADALELFLKNRENARDAEKIRQLIGQLREKAATK